MSASAVQITAQGIRGGGVPLVHRRSGSELCGAFKRDFRLAGLPAEEQRLTAPGEKLGIVGELRLDFGELAVALDDHGLGTAADASVDVSYTEVALLQGSGWFAPGDDFGAWRKIGFGLGAALDAVIGEGGVAAVFCVTARQVATDAIGIFCGMRGREASAEVRRMAGQTFFAVVSDRLGGLIVRVVAGAAPEFLVAAAGATAQGQLLNMTDDLECTTG